MARKVHDQIKAVIATWGEWTSICPCICEECIELDKKLADLVNVWTEISKQNAAKRYQPSRKSVRPLVVVREVLKIWKQWGLSPVRVQVCNCPQCKRLEPELEKLNQLIEAGPEESDN